MVRALALLFLMWPALGAAQPAGQRMLDDAEARDYLAVGRLNVAGNRHCTATLISDRVILTAAHCLYNARTGRRAPPGEMRFVAGQRRDAYAALRTVAGAATPPGYDPSADPGAGPEAVRADIALLALDAPIPAAVAAPASVGALTNAGPFWVVAYGRDRAYAASIREGCELVGALAGVMAVDCPVTFGVSGAPLFAPSPDGPRVVGVVVAGGAGNAVAVAAAPWLGELRAALETAPETMPEAAR